MTTSPGGDKRFWKKKNDKDRGENGTRGKAILL